MRNSLNYFKMNFDILNFDAFLGLEDSVKLLLNRGYRHQIYNKDTSGRIPLHNAAQNGEFIN